MDKKIIILIIILLLVLCGIGGWIYYLILVKSYNIVQNQNGATSENQGAKVPTAEEFWEQAAVDYPEMITGIINFQVGNKATIKTEDEKTYTFSPDQPKGVYEGYGATEGSIVKVQARFIDGNKIEWVMLQVIK